jgi:D-beta-D-heptose 7-phosphate kinase/D-beta-D-heptose 1-phosphate adenosyltransferase
MIISLKRVRKIISGFKSVRVAVFGDIMLDVHTEGKAERISPEAPVPIVRVKSQHYSLGGAANVMKNFSVYGSEVHAYGVVGSDEFGFLIKGLLKDAGILSAGIYDAPKRSTTRKERIIAGSQQLLRIDYEETTEMEMSLVEPMLENLFGKIERNEIDAVIVEDYAKGLVSAAILRRIVAKARKHNVICALDPHPSHSFDVKGISYMTPNMSEALCLAGMFADDTPTQALAKDRKLREVARKLMKKWQARELMITLGPDGMALFKGDDENPHLIPTKAKEVFDVSGAGDTVIALYTLSLLSGASSEEAAEIANHAAGVVVGKIGTETASFEEIIESFKSEGLI